MHSDPKKLRSFLAPPFAAGDARRDCAMALRYDSEVLMHKLVATGSLKMDEKDDRSLQERVEWLETVVAELQSEDRS